MNTGGAGRPNIVFLRWPQTPATTFLGVPDVYAEDFGKNIDQAASTQCTARKDDPLIIGYFIGNEPPWGDRENEVVDLILAGPDTATKARLKAFLAEGDNAKRRKQFVVTAFEHYLDLVCSSVRKYDPNHLILGIRFVIPGDEEWPESLDDLDRELNLNERGGPPVGLWLKGQLRLDQAVTRAVAVVGSRSATTYGVEVAATLGGGLAANSYAVVSGGAFGIDMAAHRGALAVDGPTVAVLACGADRVYPAAHKDLLAHIGASGLIVSEACLGAAPMRVRFLARNRLIAALSSGTVVVEAAWRSGALNTANWAAGLGRVLMGVPGPVTAETSGGVHELIRAKDAMLVTSPRDVLELVAPYGTQLLLPARAPVKKRDRLSISARQVLDAVPVEAPATTESIVRSAGLRAAYVTEALDLLRAHDLVEVVGGRWRVKR